MPLGSGELSCPRLAVPIHYERAEGYDAQPRVSHRDPASRPLAGGLCPEDAVSRETVHLIAAEPVPGGLWGF